MIQPQSIIHYISVTIPPYKWTSDEKMGLISPDFKTINEAEQYRDVLRKHKFYNAVSYRSKNGKFKVHLSREDLMGSMRNDYLKYLFLSSGYSYKDKDKDTENDQKINQIINYAKQKKQTPIFYLSRYSSFFQKKDRAIGCLIGLCVGDALGVTQEIFPLTSLPETLIMVLKQREQLKLNPQSDMMGGGPWVHSGTILEQGEFTDDSSMALCLADSLLFMGQLDPSDLMERFTRWWKTGYNSSRPNSIGLGGNIAKALEKFKNDPSNPIAGGTDPDKDAGNGAIMRLAPIAIYWHDDFQQAVLMARLQASVTHNIPETTESCVLMTYIMIKGIHGDSVEHIFNNLYMIIPQLKDPQIADLARLDAKWKSKSEKQIITLPGRTLWSLEAALWCLYTTKTFKDCIIKVINLGGDADTVGAIAGQMAGAIYGCSEIPSEWIYKLKYNQKITQKVIALFEKKKLNNETLIEYN